MAKKLNANFLYAQIDENNVIMVGFADDEFETKDYILLQKSLICDEQDKAMGFDKIHITFCDESHSAYGDILKFTLNNDMAEINLEAKTAKEINTEEQIEIVFNPNVEKLADIKQHLLKMFNGTEVEFVSKV